MAEGERQIAVERKIFLVCLLKSAIVKVFAAVYSAIKALLKIISDIGARAVAPKFVLKK